VLNDDTLLVHPPSECHITSHHIIQTDAIMSWVATPRAVARVRAAICQAAPIKKTYGTDSGWVAYARRRQFTRVMALRSALRAEGGAARRMLLFYSSFAVSAAR